MPARSRPKNATSRPPSPNSPGDDWRKPNARATTPATQTPAAIAAPTGGDAPPPAPWGARAGGDVAGLHRALETAHEVPVSLDDRAHVVAAEPERVDGTLRAHGRAARRAGERGDLADKRARAERRETPIAAHDVDLAGA